MGPKNSKLAQAEADFGRDDARLLMDIMLSDFGKKETRVFFNKLPSSIHQLTALLHNKKFFVDQMELLLNMNEKKSSKLYETFKKRVIFYYLYIHINYKNIIRD